MGKTYRANAGNKIRDKRKKEMKLQETKKNKKREKRFYSFNM